MFHRIFMKRSLLLAPHIKMLICLIYTLILSCHRLTKIMQLSILQTMITHPTQTTPGLRAEEFVKKHELENTVTIIRNQRRELALKNIYKAGLSCNDEDIIAILDGDDHFPDQQVFEKIGKMYSNPDHEVWATYGNFLISFNKSSMFLDTANPC